MNWINRMKNDLPNLELVFFFSFFVWIIDNCLSTIYNSLSPIQIPAFFSRLNCFFFPAEFPCRP
jgi:hypothetical protein